MFSFDATSWVPKFLLRDRNGRALAKAIEAGLNAMNAVVAEGVGCITDPAAMPEWRLDEMAWETGCFYDYNATVAEKRRMIASSYQTYRTIGTPEMLRLALESIYSACTIREWPDYDGDPYHFRVELELEDAATEEDALRAMDIADSYKPLRAVMDTMIFRRQRDQGLSTGMATVSRLVRIVECRVPRDLEINYFIDENGEILTDENGHRFYDSEEV